MLAEAEKLSPCGAARLLAAIFGRDIAEVGKRLGVPPLTPRPICPNCGKPVKLGRIFCSLGCRHEYSQIKVICDECGETFLRQRSDLLSYPGTKENYQHIFCGRKCLGKFVGRSFGFRAHPENCKGGARKWDWDSVVKLRQETGWGATRLSRKLGIPEPTISFILKKTGQT